jgi:hypothetical protein
MQSNRLWQRTKPEEKENLLKLLGERTPQEVSGKHPAGKPESK